ncbi:DUF1826 domain-containing protein [Rhodospirillum sp. A1_3_36]|uniref:DUF1826 domain-containing protein n=1 Tax=Rhodospirillum sp. A1_3_36 TaxID=3391666 RepID=UPI0039A600EA
MQRPKDILLIENLEMADHILASETSLVLWSRGLDGSISSWFDYVLRNHALTGRVLVTPKVVDRALCQITDEAGIPDSPERRWFLKDVADLVGVFAHVSGRTLVDLRVETIFHDACWRFHRDVVPFRLVTTYHGRGTQWVDSGDEEAALRDQKDYVGPMHELTPGQVALFKGSLSARGGIVHRSPPMAGTGQARLFVCLNTPSEVSPDPFE